MLKDSLKNQVAVILSNNLECLIFKCSQNDVKQNENKNKKQPVVEAESSSTSKVYQREPRDSRLTILTERGQFLIQDIMKKTSFLDHLAEMVKKRNFFSFQSLKTHTFEPRAGPLSPPLQIKATPKLINSISAAHRPAVSMHRDVILDSSLDCRVIRSTAIDSHATRSNGRASCVCRGVCVDGGRGRCVCVEMVPGGRVVTEKDKRISWLEAELIEISGVNSTLARELKDIKRRDAQCREKSNVKSTGNKSKNRTERSQVISVERIDYNPFSIEHDTCQVYIGQSKSQKKRRTTKNQHQNALFEKVISGDCSYSLAVPGHNEWVDPQEDSQKHTFKFIYGSRDSVTSHSHHMESMYQKNIPSIHQFKNDTSAQKANLAEKLQGGYHANTLNDHAFTSRHIGSHSKTVKLVNNKKTSDGGVWQRLFDLGKSTKTTKTPAGPPTKPSKSKLKAPKKQKVSSKAHESVHITKIVRPTTKIESDENNNSKEVVVSSPHKHIFTEQISDDEMEHTQRQIYKPKFNQLDHPRLYEALPQISIFTSDITKRVSERRKLSTKDDVARQIRDRILHVSHIAIFKLLIYSKTFGIVQESQLIKIRSMISTLLQRHILKMKHALSVMQRCRYAEDDVKAVEIEADTPKQCFTAIPDQKYAEMVTINDGILNIFKSLFDKLMLRQSFGQLMVNTKEQERQHHGINKLQEMFLRHEFVSIYDGYFAIFYKSKYLTYNSKPVELIESDTDNPESSTLALDLHEDSTHEMASGKSGHLYLFRSLKQLVFSQRAKLWQSFVKLNMMCDRSSRRKRRRSQSKNRHVSKEDIDTRGLFIRQMCMSFLRHACFEKTKRAIFRLRMVSLSLKYSKDTKLKLKSRALALSLSRIFSLNHPFFLISQAAESSIKLSEQPKTLKSSNFSHSKQSNTTAYISSKPQLHPLIAIYRSRLNKAFMSIKAISDMQQACTIAAVRRCRLVFGRLMLACRMKMACSIIKMACIKHADDIVHDHVDDRCDDMMADVNDMNDVLPVLCDDVCVYDDEDVSVHADGEVNARIKRIEGFLWAIDELLSRKKNSVFVALKSEFWQENKWFTRVIYIWTQKTHITRQHAFWRIKDEKKLGFSSVETGKAVKLKRLADLFSVKELKTKASVFGSLNYANYYYPSSMRSSTQRLC